MMKFRVQREPVVDKPVDQVHVPHRAGPVEPDAVQRSDGLLQFGLTTGWGETRTVQVISDTNHRTPVPPRPWGSALEPPVERGAGCVEPGHLSIQVIQEVRRCLRRLLEDDNAGHVCGLPIRFDKQPWEVQRRNRTGPEAVSRHPPAASHHYAAPGTRPRGLAHRRSVRDRPVHLVRGERARPPARAEGELAERRHGKSRPPGGRAPDSHRLPRLASRLAPEPWALPPSPSERAPTG